MAKVKCDNVRCKYYHAGKKCNGIVEIGQNGRCKTFEKGFAYYLFLVWDALQKSNFIDFVNINQNPDLRIGIYYVCRLYHIIFSESEWGTCRFLRFHTHKNGPALSYKDIMALSLDEDVFHELYADFMQGNLPHGDRKAPKKDSQPFGWLSPSGSFTETAFGEHEGAARGIVQDAGFHEEYMKWQKNNKHLTCRDFLSDIKGYCLIHNPLGDGAYMVSTSKKLSPRQKEFLYGYFIDIGDRFKAEQYINTEV